MKLTIPILTAIVSLLVGVGGAYLFLKDRMRREIREEVELHMSTEIRIRDLENAAKTNKDKLWEHTTVNYP